LAVGPGSGPAVSGRKGDVRFPTLADLRWRVDVTISTSSLNRVLKPTLLFQLTLSDGTITTAHAHAHSVRSTVRCRDCSNSRRYGVCVMNVIASAGSIRTFELTVEQFHELRFDVARVLKDMGDLENNPILKIK
jgi:hypothetical protein